MRWRDGIALRLAMGSELAFRSLFCCCCVCEGVFNKWWLFIIFDTCIWHVFFFVGFGLDFEHVENVRIVGDGFQGGGGVI